MLERGFRNKALFLERLESVTVVTAYLMKQRAMRLSQALEHIKTRRHPAAPNRGFIVQLQDFESSVHSARTI